MVRNRLQNKRIRSGQCYESVELSRVWNYCIHSFIQLIKERKKERKKNQVFELINKWDWYWESISFRDRNIMKLYFFFHAISYLDDILRFNLIP
jgi:hypothetical protein